MYWEQFERQPGAFDYTNVDQIVTGARAHHLQLLVLAWFGTWKNGNMHYVQAWVKSDPSRFPRVVRAPMASPSTCSHPFPKLRCKPIKPPLLRLCAI